MGHGEAPTVLERRNFLTRPFATLMEKDHVRLNAAWNKIAAERQAKGEKMLQKQLAAQYGVSEGLVGHYLRGREPIGVKWKLRFADFLKLSVVEIWPDFPHKKALNADLDRDVLEVALEYAEIADEKQKEAVRSMITSLPKRISGKRKPA